MKLIKVIFAIFFLLFFSVQSLFAQTEFRIFSGLGYAIYNIKYNEYPTDSNSMSNTTSFFTGGKILEKRNALVRPGLEFSLNTFKQKIISIEYGEMFKIVKDATYWINSITITPFIHINPKKNPNFCLNSGLSLEHVFYAEVSGSSKQNVYVTNNGLPSYNFQTSFIRNQTSAFGKFALGAFLSFEWRSIHLFKQNFFVEIRYGHKSAITPNGVIHATSDAGNLLFGMVF